MTDAGHVHVRSAGGSHGPAVKREGLRCFLRLPIHGARPYWTSSHCAVRTEAWASARRHERLCRPPSRLPAWQFTAQMPSNHAPIAHAQADTFSYGVVLWELITKEQTERGNWRDVVVPDECPAGVEVLLKVGGPSRCQKGTSCRVRPERRPHTKRHGCRAARRWSPRAAAWRCGAAAAAAAAARNKIQAMLRQRTTNPCCRTHQRPL